MTDSLAPRARVPDIPAVRPTGIGELPVPGTGNLDRSRAYGAPLGASVGTNGVSPASLSAVSSGWKCA